MPLDDKVQMQMVIFFSNEDDKSSAQEKSSDENMARFAILKIHLQAHAKLESWLNLDCNKMSPCNS